MFERSCCSYRIVGNLLTDNFILVLRGFISRRGYPKNIFSDNGTNFTGAQRELAKSLKCLDQDRTKKELTTQKINWNFSPPEMCYGSCSINNKETFKYHYQKSSF